MSAKYPTGLRQKGKIMKKFVSLLLVSMFLICASLLASCDIHSHSYRETITDPTCTEQGYTTYTCECGDGYVDNYIDPLGHNIISHDAKAPTCTKNGWNVYDTCEKCDYSNYIEINQKGHSPSEWIIDEEATYTENGLKHKDCLECGDLLETSIVPMLTHSYVSVVTAPTCTKKGYTTHTCTECGDIYIDDYVDQLGEYHTPGDWIVDVDATKTEDGKCHTTCTVCGELMNDIIYATGSIGIKYLLNDDGVSYYVAGIGSCTDAELVIPQMHNKLPVTRIADKAFKECRSITSVTIGNSVTSIGDEAFYRCLSLASVEIPDSVTSIGVGAFIYCYALTSVSIGNSVTSIANSTFQECSNLRSIIIPDSVTWIGRSAFLRCYSLVSITIPDSVTSIGQHAFDNCGSLTSIVIPDSVAYIGSGVCSSVTTIYCEATSKPSNWHEHWNVSNAPVVWGYTGK